VRPDGDKVVSLSEIEQNFAALWGANTFTGSLNTFNNGIKVLPLGTNNAVGQPAYGLSVTPPSSDGTSGGLQLWGVQFMQGDEWSSNALKIVHNQLALYGTSDTPTSLTFDNANVVEFKTMPDDGGAVGVTYDFQSWQWTNDSHSDKTNTAPVQILKNNAISLTEKSVLNMSESDNRYYTKAQSDDKYARLDGGNILHGDNYIDGSFHALFDALFVADTASLKIGQYHIADSNLLACPAHTQNQVKVVIDGLIAVKANLVIGFFRDKCSWVIPMPGGGKPI
jgi:hypothetical protein